MTDNELLLAFSDMIDKKLEPINSRLTEMELLLENKLKPDIQLLAENYLPAAKRFEAATEEQVAIKSDIELLKKVVTEHSGTLLRIS